MRKQSAAKPATAPVSDKVLEETQRLFVFASQSKAATELWERRLTLQDRARLGGDFYRAMNQYRNGVKMLMVARNLNMVQATLQMAVYQGVSESDRDYLLQEWGFPAEPEMPVVNDLLPVWNPATGKLYWGREPIRTVRLLTKSPSNLQILIEAFEKQNWAEVIDTPFEFEHTLHETIRALHTRGLKRIKFFAVGRASRCRWEVVSAKRA